MPVATAMSSRWLRELCAPRGALPRGDPRREEIGRARQRTPDDQVSTVTAARDGSISRVLPAPRRREWRSRRGATPRRGSPRGPATRQASHHALPGLGAPTRDRAQGASAAAGISRTPADNFFFVCAAPPAAHGAPRGRKPSARAGTHGTAPPRRGVAADPDGGEGSSRWRARRNPSGLCDPPDAHVNGRPASWGERNCPQLATRCSVGACAARTARMRAICARAAARSRSGIRVLAKRGARRRAAMERGGDSDADGEVTSIPCS